MEPRAGHLTIIVGTGGVAFGNKNCPQGRAFDHFFKCQGLARGLPGGMLAAGIDSHINTLGCGVYSRAAFIGIFSLKCGVYSRAPFNRIITVKDVLRSKLSLQF